MTRLEPNLNNLTDKNMIKHIFERDLCIKTSVITSTYPFKFCITQKKTSLLLIYIIIVESKSVKRTLNGNNMNLIRKKV